MALHQRARHAVVASAVAAIVVIVIAALTYSTTLAGQEPVIRVFPDRGFPGMPVTVVGTGWEPNKPVYIYWVIYAGIRPYHVATVYADHYGRFVYRLTSPRDPPGPHTITAEQDTRRANTTFYLLRSDLEVIPSILDRLNVSIKVYDISKTYTRARVLTVNAGAVKNVTVTVVSPPNVPKMAGDIKLTINYPAFSGQILVLLDVDGDGKFESVVYSITNPTETKTVPIYDYVANAFRVYIRNAGVESITIRLAYTVTTSTAVTVTHEET